MTEEEAIKAHEKAAQELTNFITSSPIPYPVGEKSRRLWLTFDKTLEDVISLKGSAAH